MNAPILLHELTREKARELAPQTLLVLPVGAVEQHGPHLPVGTRPVRCWELLEKPRGSRGGEKYLTPRTLRIIKGLAAGRSGNGRISPQGWDERVPDLLKGVEEEANRGQPQPLPARNCWLAGSLCDRMY